MYMKRQCFLFDVYTRHCLDIFLTIKNRYANELYMKKRMIIPEYNYFGLNGENINSF